MALVCQDFREQSIHSYTVLLEQYRTLPALAGLIPPGIFLSSAQKVKMLYLRLTIDARNCGLDLKNIELAPLFLQCIRELTLPRLQDKVSFYRAAFNALSPLLNEPFDKMTRHDIIAYSERRLKDSRLMLACFHGDLNLASLQLTHLPSQINYLSGVTRVDLDNNNLTCLPQEMKSFPRLLYLSLRGNPLSAENVKDACKALPQLQTVVIDSEQPALVEMFNQEQFPHLHVIVTQIMIEEDIEV
jgi:hypothetical protein